MARARAVRREEDESPSSEGEARTAAASGLQALVALLAPGTLIGALMFYFGWVRTQSFYAYFGIDADALDLTTRDYILRSADALWPSVSGLLLAILLVLLLHGAVSRWIDGVEAMTDTQRLVLRCPLVFGVLLSTFAIIRFPAGQQASIVIPLCAAAGFGLLAYARLIQRRLRHRFGRLGARRTRYELAIMALFVTLIILDVFWATALFARDLGQGRAQRFEITHFTTQPDVLLYTSRRQHVDARDIVERDLGQSYEPYRYRYDGFKLLTRGSGRMILVPYSWSTSNAFALVLPDNDEVRIVFAPNF